jgi:D-3-phosphoglycerate dehydrogenase
MRNRSQIVLTRTLPEPGMAVIRARADVTFEVLPAPEEAYLRAAIPNADAVVMVPEVPHLSAELIALAPRLRVACRFGAGYDNFDVPALTARRIPLATTADANSAAVAEQNFHLMLALAKCGPAYDRGVRAGNWDIRRTAASQEMQGRTVLVVGYGRVGRAVARYCVTFGMTVIVADPFVTADHADGFRHVADAREALGDADYVSLCLSLTPDSRGMFGAPEFARMKRTARIVNTSRGPLIQEAALIAALREGRIAGAGLDVLETEPPGVDNPLLTMDNVVLSPHSGAFNPETLDRMGIATARNALAGLDRTLDRRAVVNPEVL